MSYTLLKLTLLAVLASSLGAFAMAEDIKDEEEKIFIVRPSIKQDPDFQKTMRDFVKQGYQLVSVTGSANDDEIEEGLKNAPDIEEMAKTTQIDPKEDRE